MSLGWTIKDEKSAYIIDFPVLTTDEETVIKAIEELFKEVAK